MTNREELITPFQFVKMILGIKPFSGKKKGGAKRYPYLKCNNKFMIL